MLLIGALWAMLVGSLLVRIVRQGQAFRKQALARRPARGSMPTIAVVVPARNEASNIAGCLAALGEQDYPAEKVSVTVVNDSSTDDTAVEAQRFAGRAALVEAGPLPPGWLGKPHACWLGAAHAGAEWLCFIDADVRAEPALLASAVSAAQADGVDLLSVQPFQELGSFWERLIIPAGMLMIAGVKSPTPQHARSAADIAVNGQILLVRAASYHRVGGHRAARAEVCEDNALARLLKAEGCRVRVAAGEHLARVRMYRDLPSLWEGFAKNAVDIIGSDHGALAAACAGLLVAWAVPLVPLWLAVVALTGAEPAAIAGCAVACLASCVAFGVQAGALRHFRASLLLLPLLPVGVTVAAALAIASTRLRRAGRVRWKGRTYDLSDPRFGR